MAHCGMERKCSRREPFLVATGNVVAAPADVQPWLRSSHELRSALRFVTHLNATSQPTNDYAIASDDSVTVKLFMGVGFDAHDVSVAVQAALQQMGRRTLTTVVLSPAEPGHKSMATFEQCWTALEELHEKGLVQQLGVADFTRDELSHLYGKVHIKPRINQIRISAVTADLQAFAAASGIELLTHNDEHDLPARVTQAGLPSEILPREAATHVDEWYLRWVARYAVTQTWRCVVVEKGFVCEVAERITPPALAAVQASQGLASAAGACCEGSQGGVACC